MIKGIHHIAVTVSSLDRATEFYSSILGFQASKRYFHPELNLTVAELKNGADRLHLYSAEFVTRKPGTDAASFGNDMRVTGTKFISIEVGSLERACEVMRRRGVDIMSGPMPGPSCRTVAYIRDPDGTVIELREPY